jgi:hypothetical protein
VDWPVAVGKRFLLIDDETRGPTKFVEGVHSGVD